MRRSEAARAFAILACLSIFACADRPATDGGERQSNEAAQPSPSREQPTAFAAEHVRRHYRVPDDFNGSEVRNLKRKALGGSIEAAGDLRFLYANCPLHNQTFGASVGRPSSEECIRESDRWLRITAENGGTRAASSLFEDALGSTNCEEVYRARYWLTRVRSDGPVKSLIGVEKEIEAKEAACVW
jgi:hypothetical protein